MSEPSRASSLSPHNPPPYLAVSIPSRETSISKAMRYVATGRLRVLSVHGRRVWAECRGDGDVYQLGFAHGRWHCSCPARTTDCAHLRALRLVVDRPDSPRPSVDLRAPARARVADVLPQGRRAGEIPQLNGAPI